MQAIWRLMTCNVPPPPVWMSHENPPREKADWQQMEAALVRADARVDTTTTTRAPMRSSRSSTQ